MAGADWPSVSVIVPVRNAAERLSEAVASILSQDYPGGLQVVLAIAPSEDGTERVAAQLADQDPRVIEVANPNGSTPSGLNRAIDAASGEVIVRVDGHAELAQGYITNAVEILQRTGAWNVGGIQRAVGETPVEREVAAAMSSRFGTGDARFHYGGKAGPTDTVYLGVWPRQVLTELGGFDETLIRNQDYELNVRIRDAGGTVWFDPRLQATYRPRATLRALASQYWQYGRWKRAVLRLHPGSLRWRQAVPPLALLANLVGLAGAVLVPWLLVIPGVYVGATLVASIIVARGHPARALRLLLVFTLMHNAWGAGFLAGPPRR